MRRLTAKEAEILMRRIIDMMNEDQNKFVLLGANFLVRLTGEEHKIILNAINRLNLEMIRYAHMLHGLKILK